MTNIAGSGSGSTPKCHGSGTLVVKKLLTPNLQFSVADLHHVDADPDAAFHDDADPDPDSTFFALMRNQIRLPKTMRIH